MIIFKMDRFYNLPGHLLELIYSFDSTFYEYFKKVVTKLTKNKRIYYPSGLSLFLQYEKTKNGIKNGWYIEYYTKKTPKFVCFYINGLKEGPVLEYYSNGNIFRKYYCKSNKIVGEYKEFYNNGNLMISCFYNQHEKRNGHLYEYYLNACLYKEAFYENGILTGLYKMYKENGEILKVFNYDFRNKS